jgi:hypothetical protein
MNPKHPPGPAMTLGNMREQGINHLIAYCLNNECRHSALIDTSGYPDHIEVSLWRAKCGGKRVDVRPNWKRRRQSDRLAIRKIGHVLLIVRRYLRRQRLGSDGRAVIGI